MVGSIRRALAAVATLSCAMAAAQSTYPSKPIRLVAGFPPSSAADVVMRIVAPPLGAALGQPVIIDNRPGASSNIATEAVARAAPDGYTLLLGSVANTINTSLYKRLPFDFNRDFTAVAGLASLPVMLVVHPSVPARSVKELVTVANARPEGLMFASSGNGTAPHLSGELFNLLAGTKLVHVPYKGSPQALTDLLAGRVLVMFSPVSTVLPHVKSGALRALATTGLTRTALAPEVPTVAESGLPGFETFEASVWLAIVAPSDTSREIVDRLASEVARVLALPEVKAQLAAQGADPMLRGPEALSAYIQSETVKWARVVKTSGATVD